jgi:voltage-gated potassium channel
LTHNCYGEDLFEIKKQEQWTTYRDAFLELLNHGATLISDGTELDINRRLDEPIPSEARLFVICNHEVYRKLMIS